MQQAIPETKLKAEPQPSKAKSVSGLSIAEILSSKKQTPDKEDSAKQEEKDVKVDERIEEKLLAAKDKFIETLTKQRPRLGIAFSEMSIKGARIKITVPSDALKEEIIRNQTEVLMLMSEISTAEGRVELDIEVVEKLEGFAPIKVDDKLKFLLEKNPLLGKLKKAIELDFE